MFEQGIVGVWISNRGIQSDSQSILTPPETSRNQRQFRLMSAFISVHKNEYYSWFLLLALTLYFSWLTAPLILAITVMTGMWYRLKRKEARTAGPIRGEEVWERKAACWREIKMFMILRKGPWSRYACCVLEPSIYPDPVQAKTGLYIIKENIWPIQFQRQWNHMKEQKKNNNNLRPCIWTPLQQVYGFHFNLKKECMFYHFYTFALFVLLVISFTWILWNLPIIHFTFSYKQNYHRLNLLKVHYVGFNQLNANTVSSSLSSSFFWCFLLDSCFQL